MESLLLQRSFAVITFVSVLTLLAGNLAEATMPSFTVDKMALPWKEADRNIHVSEGHVTPQGTIVLLGAISKTLVYKKWTSPARLMQSLCPLQQTGRELLPI